MIDHLVIFTAKYVIVLPVIVVLVLLAWQLRQKKWQFLAVVVIGGIISLALAKIGGHFVTNPRPFVVGHFTPLIPHANDNGFPSDHTLLAAVLAFAATWLKPKYAWPLILVAVGIGLSRVAAGVHHYWDIIGSLIFALIGVLIAIGIVKLFNHRAQAKLKSDQ